MSKALLTEEQFSRIVVTRAKREHPDLRVRAMGKFFLMVEPEPGQPRLVPLFNLYQTYCDSPTQRDDMIETFLQSLAEPEPRLTPGSYAEVQRLIMPQVVPPSLLEFCRRDGRELCAMNYVGELAIAFVVDEPERYTYLQRQTAEEWGISVTALLATALKNLQALNHRGAEFNRFGSDDQLTLVWETFDGYDASRVLLSRDLQAMAVEVAGNPLVAIPHRDYLVVFGDLNPEFVAEMCDRVRVHFESHPYPISPRLYTLVDGRLEVYQGDGAGERILN